MPRAPAKRAACGFALFPTGQRLTWLLRKPRHQAVHYPFTPAKRNQGRYAKAKVTRPETMGNTQRNYQTQPRWVRDRRYGIHGIDHLQTDPIERHNLIDVPADRDRIAALKKQLFDELEASGGMNIPLRRPAGDCLDQRKLRR